MAEEKREHVMVVDNTDRELNKKVKKRTFEAIKESGLNVDSLEPVTRDEALRYIHDALGWQSFVENGGLEWHYYEGSITNRIKEQVGLVVVGPRNPTNPRLGKVGAVGIKGGFIPLGNF